MGLFSKIKIVPTVYTIRYVDAKTCLIAVVLNHLTVECTCRECMTCSICCIS